MTFNTRLVSQSGLARSIIAAAGVLGLAHSVTAQTWTKITRNPPSAINLMLLLTDGTVMASANNGSSIGNGWYKLTPDIHGSYINGTWTTLASMADTRLYYPAQILKDGRVFIAGGEYGTGGPKAEIYNPLTNTWTGVTPPAALWSTASNNFYDCNSDLTTDGSVLIMPVFPHASGVGLLYNPATNTWSNAGRLFRGTYQDEASWVKLPDHSILTIDPFGTFSERYISSTNTWINDGVVPVSLYDSFGSELGGAVFLPNGKAFFLGATCHTTLYTPSGSNTPGVWVAGPDIPGNHGTPDAPAAMMANGKVLCAVSPVPTSADHFPPPTTFYEYDYLTNSFTSVTGPTGASLNVPTYTTAMLDLPNGDVLFSRFSTSVYSYHPAGAPLPSWKPVINSVSLNRDGSFHLTGTQLNGISQGATYGDDLQMNTNYPIVRVINSSGTNVYYARTFNWSNTGIATGPLVVSTEFTVPAMPPGLYTIVVSANGISSDPFCLNAPFITPGLTSFTTCPGGSASMSVTAGGIGPLTYQWRRGTTNLTNAGEFGGVSTSTLTINPAGPTDAGTNYNCVVTNGCGSVTSTGMTLMVCAGDFNCDGVVDFFDYDQFVVAFEAGDPRADFNRDTSVDFFDYDEFVVAFESPC